MEKIRYGVIGLGNQGSCYVYEIFDKDRDPNGIVTAACDIDPKKIETMKEKTKNKDIAYFTDYTELLDSGLCDAVLVETPHYLHPVIVSAALERGIHAISDKPAGVYAKQVREMNELAEKSEAKFGMMFNQRTNCIYRKMHEMVQSGELGEIQRVTWIITNWFRPEAYYRSGGWRATWDGEGGGVLINQCPHQLDLLQWIVGELPVSVNGFCKYGRWHDIEVEDEVTAYFEYKNGATGVFITSTGEAPGTNRLAISGTKGKLICENDVLTFWRNTPDNRTVCLTTPKPFDFPEYENVPVETDGKNEQHAGIVANFSAFLLGLEEQFVPGVEGIKGVQLMNAIEYSGWHGGARVACPVDEEDYLRELNERRKTSRIKTNVVETVADTSNTFGGVK